MTLEIAYGETDTKPPYAWYESWKGRERFFRYRADDAIYFCGEMLIIMFADRKRLKIPSQHLAIRFLNAISLRCRSRDHTTGEGRAG